MPELPEVETVVRDLGPQLAGRSIEAVDLWLQKMVRYPEPGLFISRLTGCRIETVERRGKYIVMPLNRRDETGSGRKADAGADWRRGVGGQALRSTQRRCGAVNVESEAVVDGPQVTPAGGRAPCSSLFVHLGMTGHLRVHDPDAPLPKHTHLRARLDDGRELRFDDQRQFGRLLLGSEYEVRRAGAFPSLGPEPLDPDLTPQRFGELSRRRKRPLKAALLDQTFLAGLGNIYADEACFVAGIRPTRQTNRLTVRERHALYWAIRHVLLTSIGARGSSVINYVDGFGLPGNNQEKLLVYGRRGEPCLRCGEPLRSMRFAGRGTVYCRRCQR